MLGEFITRGLVLAFGYAYPALECFRTVEKNRVENEELRFWCQYWIIVAVITVLERVGDIFVSWLPMYGEAKLALFIYLWYPKTKGSGYVYEAIFRPFVTEHETDIERILHEFKVRAMDLAIYYWHNCTELGQTKFFEVLQYLTSQSANMVRPNSERVQNQHPNASTGTIPPPPRPPSAPSAPPLPSAPSIASALFRRHKQSSSKAGQPPIPPPSLTSRRVVAQSPKAELVQVQLEGKTAFVHVADTTMLDENNGPGPNNTLEQSALDQTSHLARFKLRRSKPHR